MDPPELCLINLLNQHSQLMGNIHPKSPGLKPRNGTDYFPYGKWYYFQHSASSSGNLQKCLSFFGTALFQKASCKCLFMFLLVMFVSLLIETHFSLFFFRMHLFSLFIDLVYWDFCSIKILVQCGLI